MNDSYAYSGIYEIVAVLPQPVRDAMTSPDGERYDEYEKVECDVPEKKRHVVGAEIKKERPRPSIPVMEGEGKRPEYGVSQEQEQHADPEDFVEPVDPVETEKALHQREARTEGNHGNERKESDESQHIPGTARQKPQRNVAVESAQIEPGPHTSGCKRRRNSYDYGLPDVFDVIVEQSTLLSDGLSKLQNSFSIRSVSVTPAGIGRWDVFCRAHVQNGRDRTIVRSVNYHYPAFKSY